jgi:hypothetical protein
VDALQTEDQLTEFLQKAIYDDNHNNRSPQDQSLPPAERNPVPCFTEAEQFDFFSPTAEADLITPDSPLSWPSSPF